MMHQTQPHSEYAGRSLGGKLLMTLALGLLLAASWRCTSATHSRRSGSQQAKLPRRLQTWEGEGGRPVDEDDRDPDRYPDALPRPTAGDGVRR